MFYTIYKTTNKINGNIYIGKHQTKDPNDNYLGSGKLILYAIKKYGIENFEKEVICIFDNEEEMNIKEAELVTEDFIKKDTNYNLCPGGHGGWGYINSSGMKKFSVSHTEETRKILSEKGHQRIHSADTIEKIKKNNERTNKSRGQKVKIALTGKPKTENHKRKISEALKNSKKIIKSPRKSGTHLWITDGNKNKRIKITEDIPNGWKRGCTINKIWITNTKQEKRINIDETIPYGWCRGRKVKN